MLARQVAILALVLAGLATTGAQQAVAPKVITVTAAVMGGEFEKDTDSAVKKYLPPKAGEGGVLINLTGVVAQVDGQNREVGLQAGSNSRIVLHGKNIAGIKAGDTVKVERATFRTYARRTILIDCGDVRLAK